MNTHLTIESISTALAEIWRSHAPLNNANIQLGYDQHADEVVSMGLLHQAHTENVVPGVRKIGVQWANDAESFPMQAPGLFSAIRDLV